MISSFQLKKKTSELNRACEKHYQIEQDLAFHKIDSKFDSLGRGPEQSLDEVCIVLTLSHIQ